MASIFRPKLIVGFFIIIQCSPTPFEEGDDLFDLLEVKLLSIQCDRRLPTVTGFSVLFKASKAFSVLIISISFSVAQGAGVVN